MHKAFENDMIVFRFRTPVSFPSRPYTAELSLRMYNTCATHESRPYILMIFRDGGGQSGVSGVADGDKACGNIDAVDG